MGRRTAAAFTPIALLGLIAVILAGCAALGLQREKATSEPAGAGDYGSLCPGFNRAACDGKNLRTAFHLST